MNDDELIDDILAKNETHRHRYYPFQVKQVFEKVGKDEALYRMVWYGFSKCNCGSWVKREVLQEEAE